MADSDPFEWRLVGTTLTSASTDNILPVINSHFYYVLNEAGSGEITLPLNSTSAGVITEGMLVVLYYRGAIRGSFLVENIRKVPASSQEGAGEVLSVSGRGGMAVLDRAIIWGDGTTSKTRTFTAVTKASILLTLITEAQTRGGLTTLTCDFDAADDTDNVAWTDSETYTLNVGMSLLDVLRQFAKTGIDFEVNYSGTGFVLSAYKNGIGTNKASTVFFRTGTNCQEIDIDQRGNDIRNALLVAYKAGEIVVSDSTSITANGRREELLDARLAQTSASATTYGAAILETKKDARIGRTIRVYDGIPPYLFINYILGDTVALDIKGTVTEDRVLGIQCDFNAGEYSNVVIELNSLMLEQNIKLQQDVDYLLNQWNTANDAGLLEISYWDGIGDRDMDNINSLIIVGRKLYVTGDFGGYYNAMRVIDLSTGASTWIVGIFLPRKMISLGTDLYVTSAPGLAKVDVTTDTVVDNSVGVAGGLSAHIDTTEYGACSHIQYLDGYIYAFGFILTADGIPVNGMAKLDVATEAWSVITETIDGYDGFFVTASAIVGGVLYVAINNTGVRRVYAFDGVSAWSAVGSDMNGVISVIKEYGADILIGGSFTGGIAILSGSVWATFGGGTTGAIYDIEVYLTDVYVTGAFTDLASYIAKYSGDVWYPLLEGLNGAGSNLVLDGTNVIVGGAFTLAGTKDVLNLAEYFTEFQALLDHLSNGNFDLGAAIHNALAASITDASELPFWDAVSEKLRKITFANLWLAIKTKADLIYVALTGNQTVAGVKTFSSFPVTPSSAPTTDYQVVNKKYVDGDYVLVERQETNSTEGGTNVADTWTALDMNTEVSDASSICSVASSQITLAAGTYKVHITASFYFTLATVIRLYNTSDSAQTLISQSAYIGSGAAETADIVPLSGRFTIAATKTFEIQYLTEQVTASFGLGVSMGARLTNYTGNEIYARARFRRIG